MRGFKFTVCATLCLAISANAGAQTWDSEADFTLANNPNGAWTYARRFTPEGTSIEVCGYVFASQFWIPGPGLYAPHFQNTSQFPKLTVWADNNALGLPVLRWTSPSADSYDVGVTFTIVDGRGGDNFVYVVINGAILFSDTVRGFNDSAATTFAGVALQAGDTVDFVFKWDDAVPYQDYGQTEIAAHICKAGSGCTGPAVSTTSTTSTTSSTSTSVTTPPCAIDDDGDNEGETTDRCPGTPSGEEVDSVGCSLTQFCNAVDATTKLGAKTCRRADWKNDEPLAKTGDCTIARGQKGGADDRCVPSQ